MALAIGVWIVVVETPDANPAQLNDAPSPYSPTLCFLTKQ